MIVCRVVGGWLAKMSGWEEITDGTIHFTCEEKQCNNNNQHKLRPQYSQMKGSMLQMNIAASWTFCTCAWCSRHPRFRPGPSKKGKLQTPCQSHAERDETNPQTVLSASLKSCLNLCFRAGATGTSLPADLGSRSG